MTGRCEDEEELARCFRTLVGQLLYPLPAFLREGEQYHLTHAIAHGIRSWQQPKVWGRWGNSFDILCLWDTHVSNVLGITYLITTDNPTRSLVCSYFFGGLNLISQVVCYGCTSRCQSRSPACTTASHAHRLLIVSHHFRCCSLLVPV